MPPKYSDTKSLNPYTLHREQQERDERDRLKREGGLDYEPAPSFAELGMNPGSFDAGDPFTTNL